MLIEKRCDEEIMGRAKKFTDEQLWEATKGLLLEVGYDAFTISLLAEKMAVSRAVIYKYYPNKEELILQFMLIKMEESVALLSAIDCTQSFLDMFRDMLKRIFYMKDLHEILGLAYKISNVNELIVEKKAKLSAMHHEMYKPLRCLIAKGKEENLIGQEKDDFLVLGFIFSAINIPNHSNLPEEQFLHELENLLLNGIVIKK